MSLRLRSKRNDSPYYIYLHTSTYITSPVLLLCSIFSSHFGAIQSERHPEFADTNTPLSLARRGLGVRLKNVLHANEKCFISVQMSQLNV